MSAIKFSAQTTVEYVMIYAATGLIIGVVLVVLAWMGVFNLSTQVPTTQMGSCRLARQIVLGNGVQVSQLGNCRGRPLEFFTQFNGQNSKISIPLTPLSGRGSFSIFTWIKTNTTGIRQGIITIGSQYCTGKGVMLSIDSTGYLEEGLTCSSPGLNSAPVIVNDGKFHFVGVVDNAGMVQLYVDGAAAGNAVSQSPNLGKGFNYIGVDASSYFFNGIITNVQVYNTSLSTDEIQSLYGEWISGAPLPLPTLIGWWQLNGDTSDYSGNNNNNGVPFNVLVTTVLTTFKSK